MAGSVGESNSAQVFTKRIGVKGDLYAATLSADLVVDGSHGTKLYLTPTAACDVTMPALDLCIGVTYQITNAATGDYALTIKAADDSTITTIAQGEIGWVHCTGEMWQSLGKADLTTGTPNVGDMLVSTELSVGAGTGNDKPLTLTLKRADGTTAIASARTVLILTQAIGSGPSWQSTPVSTVTFSTATVGSIVVSSNGWALVTTSSAGAFACTCTDSADESIELYAVTAPGLADSATRCLVLPGVYTDAVWS